MLRSRQGNSRKDWRLRAALAATTILASNGANIAFAQNAGSLGPPPVRQPIDENGVDVLRGTFNASNTGISIGGGGGHGLSYGQEAFGSQSSAQNWRDSSAATLTQSGSLVTVTINGSSDTFTVSGSTYTATQGNGATLVYAFGIYTYTTRTGVVANFTSNTNYFYSFYQSTLGTIADITFPSGTKVTYTYKEGVKCSGGWENGSCPGTLKTVIRLQSINNSNGYQLKFSYAYNGTEIDGSNFASWAGVASVKAINNALEYCSPSADSCSLTGSWPSASYSQTVVGTVTTRTMTDAASRVTTYKRDSSTNTFMIKRPGAATDNVTVTYGGSGVASVTTNGVAYTYGYSDAGTTRTTTVTNPNGGTKVYIGDTTTFLISSFKDELNRTTAYTYDGNGRVTQITYPEGNKVQYTYDTRGNVTQTRAISKTPGTPADIVTSAAFPASCTNAKTCNKPTSTTDAKGNVTDYTYDATHGGVLTETAPAATVGGIRPQTRYTYATRNAYFKLSAAGAPSASFATYKLTATSACQTTASCTGGADEVKTTVDYGPQVAGTGNNLLPVGVSSGSGDGALTATTAFTYDDIGNRLTVDGPLAGAADTTRTRYDAVRQVIGIVGPDPDGAGSLPDRAQRLTYNADGQVTLAELGTVTDQSDAAWAAFSTQQQVATTYDANARPIKQQLQSGGTTYALSQTSYDALGRVDCQAVRMDPAQWASQSVVCTPQTTGPNGPDRITKTIYDAASQVTQMQTAVGTTDATNEVTATFNANGTAATVKDGENNLTTYEYDGFDRLTKTRYPSSTQGSGTSSTTDYEQLTLDANGNVTQRRLRDGQVQSFTFDNLNRVTLKDVPNTVYAEFDISYAYDLLGRLTQALDSNTHVTNFGYDALSRKTSEQSNWTTRTWQYDAAGRRTRLTWGDAFFVTYDYDTTGNVTAIRENGAASGIGVLGTYAYDNLGRRTSLTRGNGTVTSYAFDPVSRLSSLTQDLAGTANDLTINGFTYNPASQIGALTRSNDAYAWGGHYNVNRNYTLNGLNQMTAAGATSLSYDGRGNLTNSGSSVYGYTSENRLATAPGGYFMTYDPLGRYHWIANGGPLVWMQYDGDNIIEERDGSGVVRRYVYGPGEDEPLVWYEGSGTSDRRWLHADERGSVVAVSNASGTAIAINSYDEYGIPASTNMGRFQYTGQAWIPELGMYYYKARIYSPTLGRFMQTDPIGYDAGMNLYNYVGSDPVNFADPSGLLRQPDAKPYEPPPPEIVVQSPCYGCRGGIELGVELGILGNLSLLDARNLVGIRLWWNKDLTKNVPGVGPKKTPKNGQCAAPSDTLDAAETALDAGAVAADGATVAMVGLAGRAFANRTPQVGLAFLAGASKASSASTTLSLFKAAIQLSRGNNTGAGITLASALIGYLGGPLAKFYKSYGGVKVGKTSAEIQATVASQVAGMTPSC